MSRHRNVRNYAYEDDMSDDVYGHSVEDHDMCISPSTVHQFMYNRNNEDQKRNVFGHYMDTRFGSVEEQVEEEQSEEEDHLSHSQDYRRPQLDPISQAKLSSCLDQLQSILGDDCHEPTAVEAIIKFDFDAEKALDYIFEKGSNKGSNRQTKKSDSSLCSNLSCKLIPTTFVTATTLNSLSSEHLAQTQWQHCDSLSSTMPLSLNDFVQNKQPAKGVMSFSISQNVANSDISLLGQSLKSLAEGDKLLKKNPNSMAENDLMTASLSSLSNSSVGGLSKVTRATRNSFKNSLMTTSLSSLASQGDNKSMAKWPFENLSDNALFTTSLSSLAGENSIENMPGVTDTSETNNPTETLKFASLSSLSMDSHLPKTVASSFEAMNTSLSSLASQNDSPFMPSSLFESSRPGDKLYACESLSSLANQSTCSATNNVSGISHEKRSSVRGHNLSHELLETSLSLLSISTLNSQQVENVSGPSLSMATVGLDSMTSKEPRIVEAKSTKYKETEDKRSAKKSLRLLKESTAPARKIKKHGIRSKYNPLVRIKPSMFGFTLCYSSKRNSDILMKGSRRKRLCPIKRYYGFGNIVPFDFQTPSPDDFIKLKQRQGFSH